MEIIPRSYQSEAVEVVANKLRGPTKRALIVMATGLGKTITAALVTKELRPSRTLFLVHNNFILDHAKREFADVLGPEVSMAVENGLTKSKKTSTAMITFATWQKMSRTLERYPPSTSTSSLSMRRIMRRQIPTGLSLITLRAPSSV